MRSWSGGVGVGSETAVRERMFFVVVISYADKVVLKWLSCATKMQGAGKIRRKHQQVRVKHANGLCDAGHGFCDDRWI